MAYARPAKSLREMTAAERAAHNTAANAEVEKVSAAIANDFKRRNAPTDCLLWDYLKWAGAGKRCMLFVRHPHHSTKGSMVSRAGDDAEQFFLPDSQCEVRPQSTDKFLLAIVSKFIRGKMPAAWTMAGSDNSELFGNDWSDAELEAWASLSGLRWKIDYEIDMAPRRLRRGSSNSLSITSTISPGNAA
ncbi:MAG: hypothetical protein E6Q77_00320 [Rhizobium sp.]|nr:MAG: hypothetical protein E6Q77_00320 [Rhizobium sp.]